MSLSLGLQGISLAEAALIRTIVRLSSSLSPAWEVAEAGAPCHLLIHDGPVTGDPQGPQGEAAQCVAVSARGSQAIAGQLQRPIRAEALLALLNAEGQKLVRGQVAALARPADTPPALQAAPAADSMVAAGAAARLNKWPSWDVLQGRSHALKLATHLSRAAYNAERLSQGTGVPLADCREFMQQLDGLGLLAWQAAVSAPAARVVPAPATAPRATHGLLHSIRRRLRLA